MHVIPCNPSLRPLQAHATGLPRKGPDGCCANPGTWAWQASCRPYHRTGSKALGACCFSSRAISTRCQNPSKMPTEARKHQFMRIGRKGWDELRHERHCRHLSSRFYRSPRFSQVATHPHMQGNLPQLRVLPCMLVRADTTRKVRFLMGTVCVSQPALRLHDCLWQSVRLVLAWPGCNPGRCADWPTLH